MSKPCPTLLSLMVDADFNTGELRWKKRPIWMFRDKASWSSWNKRYAGRYAFKTKRLEYFVGKIDGVVIPAHRVVFTLANKTWPQGQVDHINGVYTDNQLCNLRDVSQQENALNRKRQKNNTTGINGLTKLQSGKWRARLSVSGRRYYLKDSICFGKAVSALASGKDRLGFHKNHGRCL